MIDEENEDDAPEILEPELVTVEALGAQCYWYRAYWVRWEEFTWELDAVGLEYWFSVDDEKLKISVISYANVEGTWCAKPVIISLPVRMGDRRKKPEYVILPPLVAPMLGIIAGCEMEIKRREITNGER